jgi:hypothetical protein
MVDAKLVPALELEVALPIGAHVRPTLSNSKAR